jgi:phosphatidylserine/phosphatidylglycerophosphate/cardiolipin synthase-like enzyme
MRFRSEKVDGYRVYVVTGANVASFAIDAEDADTKNLLGFSVYRIDPSEDQEYWIYGFKVFKSVIPQPSENIQVLTLDHPVQSFVWDDFTCKPNRIYEYRFHPVKGKPKKLEHGDPLTIRIKTEKLFSNNDHDVFFNRGVASSQAYARKFGNLRPDKQKTESKRKEAWEWLSRSLDEALFKFIGQAKRGDTLLGCFYEFHYLPVLEKLKEVMDQRGVRLRVIIDAKKNEHTDKKGFHESFPREANLRALKKAKIPKKDILFLRQARKNSIQHNKFMVLLKGQAQTPSAVWTGSTNLSEGGIFGQTNVGHWTRNKNVAELFKKYWELIAKDPGGDGVSAAAKQANKKFRDEVEDLLNVPVTFEEIPQGVTPIFSPRSGLGVLELYEKLIDEADRVACITLAFGIGKGFKARLKNNSADNALLFLLLEKKDIPNKRSKEPFFAINAKNNAYKAWGAFIEDPVYQWTREVSTRHLTLNKHVAYIHSKFLLKDPLGDDPVVVTGSANFSEPSTDDNDENMLIIRGDRRMADIYFTEFNRLFHHYYFRSVWEEVNAGTDKPSDEDSLFLKENDSWLDKYKPGKLRAKRVKMFAEMEGISDPP